MKLKVLHLIDDEKFTDFIIEQNKKFIFIENTSISHTFLGLGNNYKYTRKQHKNLILKPTFIEYKNFIHSKRFDILIVHCITQYKLFALDNCLDNFKSIIWSIWGVDFYNDRVYKISPYFKETSKLIKSKSLNTRLKDLVRPYYFRLKYGSTLKKSTQNFIRSINYFACIVPNEYKLAQQVPNFNAKYLPYSYVNIESTVGRFNIQENQEGNNIFIGNSATPESNHLDVLKKLKSLNIEDSKIIVPLSYGQPETYGKQIIEYGNLYFNKNFIGIKNFIPIDVYVEKVKSCSICILAHKRQQGLGNALLFLLLGSKLFLSKVNPMYDFFISRGITVFSIEDDLNQMNIENKLDQNIINSNRKIVKDYYSEEAVDNLYHIFYSNIILNL